MRRISVSAAIAGVVMGLHMGADAAYPVNNSMYQGVNAQGQLVYLPGTAANTMIVANGNTAASPTRVTGSLPRVGSNVVSAGRQYYQPADYDRLADSGLYVGFSIAYSASIMGDVSADYMGEANAFFVPGAFKAASYNTDTVLPLQLSVGAALNNDVRIDFSYLRYSGISYPDMVQTSKGDGTFTDATVDGGAITANATMLNVYYNIDSFTGYLAGGMLRPYIGAGVGIALNTIADYVVYDGEFYPEKDINEVPGLAPGVLTGISDIYAYHNGGTAEQLAFMLEGGLTTDLDGGIKMDFFVRYANLGKVKTSGSVVVSQTEWLATGGIDVGGGTYEEPAPYDSVFHYTNWTESGRLGMVDVGIRLRLQF